MITKIFLDPKQNYRATLIGRVFSGTLDEADSIYLVNQRKTQRIKRLGVMEITDILDIDQIPAGNLFALYGFICPSGETFIAGDMKPDDKDDAGLVPSFESISYACEAVVSRSIKPRDPQDLAKLGQVVKKWLMADPTAEFRLDKESKEYILSGIDPLQIDILTKRINNQVEIDIGEPIIVYREKITEESRDFHTKSANGHNRIELHITPLDEKTQKLLEEGKITDLMNEATRAEILREEADWDSKKAKKVVDVYRGNVMVNGTKGLQRLTRVQSYLTAAFRDWVDNCILADEPAMGMKVTFTDMTIHEDPAHTGYNQIAGMLFAALSLAMMDADPHLFEPVQKINVKTPTGTESGVLAIINQHRGRIDNVIPKDEYIVIDAKLPASETIGIADEIRSATQGKAFFGYEFSGFEQVPRGMEEELILDIRERKDMKVELPDVSSWSRFLYKRS
jgi:elongation factor 2